jgi:hypothetical protein
MSKPEKKTATVTTGKVKDLVVTPEVKQAFGGEPDDTVVSIKLPGAAHKVEEAQPVDASPTDRQIQNAERILKAAGRGMNRKLGTVTVDGVEIEPIATGIKTDLTSIYIKELGEAIHLPGTHGYRVSDREFKLFSVKVGVNQNYYLLDDESSVELNIKENRRNRFGFEGGSVAARKSIMALVNSSSTDDTVVGEAALINVISQKNLLNSSALIATEDVVTPHGYGYNGLFADHAVDKPWEISGKKIESIKSRATVSESQFKRTTVVNSMITQGSYLECQFNRCTIEASGFTSASRSYLDKTTLSGTRMTLKNVNLGSCTVRSEAELLIKYSVFNNLMFSGKTIHILNKFNYLSLDTPASKMFLVRASNREFDLGTSVYNLQRLKLNCTIEEVRKVISGVMSIDEEGFPVAETSITRSFANYLTESVMSRLKVIQLIDEAKQLVRDVGAKNHAWDDMYSA